MSTTEVIDMGLMDRRLATERAAKLDALSKRMLRHGEVAEWRRVFLGPALRGIRFELAQMTLVTADAPLAAISRSEREQLAALLGGTLQLSRNVDLVLAFAEASEALQAAMMLQRLSAARPVRTALSTAMCTVGCYEAEGAQQRVVCGAEMEQAEAGLAQAAHGTVMMCAQTYAALGEGVNEQVQDCVLATEMDEETVTRACITLPPHASAQQSTFAGLGVSFG